MAFDIYTVLHSRWPLYRSRRIVYPLQICGVRVYLPCEEMVLATGIMQHHVDL